MKINKFIKKLVFSVGLKINIILAAIFVLFIVSMIVNQYYFDLYSDSYNNQLSSFYLIQNMKSCFSKSERSLSDYLKTGNRLQLAEYNHAIADTKKLIITLSNFEQDDETYFLIQSIRKAHDIYFSEGCQASFFYNTGNYDYYGRLYYTEKICSYLQNYADELLNVSLINTAEKTQTFLQSRKVIKVYTMIFFLCIVSIFFIFHWYVSTALTKPLYMLVQQAQSVSAGNFNIQVAIRNPKNSVGVLTAAFNTMVNDVKKNVEYQKLLNQATFLALQTQTNPHFLFNTLNCISRTISLNKKDTALQMIDSLSILLRYSLSESERPVSLQEELEITEEYLKIQKLRFGKRIEYIVHIPNDLSPLVLLPKFTLQPLVENAIIHGLEPKEGGGKIIISSIKRGDYAILRIFDNGIGIPKEKIHSILSANPAISKRIGVANTKSRLEIFTKQKEDAAFPVFSIFSRQTEYESWTMIQIRLKISNKDSGEFNV